MGCGANYRGWVGKQHVVERVGARNANTICLERLTCDTRSYTLEYITINSRTWHRHLVSRLGRLESRECSADGMGCSGRHECVVVQLGFLESCSGI